MFSSSPCLTGVRRYSEVVRWNMFKPPQQATKSEPPKQAPKSKPPQQAPKSEPPQQAPKSKPPQQVSSANLISKSLIFSNFDGRYLA